MRSKVKNPTAFLSEDWQTIRVNNISRSQFVELYLDIEIHVHGTLRRFSTIDQERNYFFINKLYISIHRKITGVRAYYNLVMPTAGARCFITNFSKTTVGYSTLEFIGLLNQKLPILC